MFGAFGLLPRAWNLCRCPEPLQGPLSPQACACFPLPPAPLPCTYQIFNAYSQKTGQDAQLLRFLWDSQRVRQEQTPEDLGMESGDIVSPVGFAGGGVPAAGGLSAACAAVLQRTCHAHMRTERTKGRTRGSQRAILTQPAGGAGCTQ